MSVIQSILPPRLLLVYAALHMGVCEVDKENSIINFNGSFAFDSTLAFKYKAILDDFYQVALATHRQTYPGAEVLDDAMQAFYNDLYSMLDYLINNL